MNCAHKGCNCQADATRKDGYCSGHCAQAGPASGSGGCGCGHAGCA
jgi:hypothetical protein